MKKGAVQIDYVIAIGFFIFILAFSLNFLLNYLSSYKDSARIQILRSEATSFMDKIYNDLGSDAYRIFILVNNTQGDLINELVSFNLSCIEAKDLNSTRIYEMVYANNTITYNKILYQRNNEIYTFAINISAGTTKTFIVYFDDDSNFTDSSISVNGINNLTAENEKQYPPEKIFLLQYKKIINFINNSYDSVKDNASIDFRIKLFDINNQTVMDFGQTPPSKGSIVALQKYIIYQNDTDIRNGRLIIQVW